MELRVLRYFLTVAREESISGAAQALHLSQPTLSRQLMALEEEIGKPLFIQGSRHVTLTEDGVLLRKRANEILSLVEKTQSELRETELITTGDIYIGGGETDGMALLADAVRRFQARYPQVRFHLFSANADDLFERMEKGLLDFGLILGASVPRKYDSLRLPAKNHWGLVVPKGSRLAGQESISPEDLRELPLLTSQQSQVASELSQWLGYDFSDLRVVATYSLVYNAALMVEAGVGCALTLNHLINTGEDSGVCFRPLSPTLECGMSLVWPKYQVRSKVTEAFFQFLVSHLRSVSTSRKT